MRDAVSRHQVVMYIGARGTGKTTLVSSLSAALRATGMRVVTVSADTLESPMHANSLVGDAFGVSDRLPKEDELKGAPVRVLVDRCEALFDAPWLPILQDTWRAFFTAAETQGKASLAMVGRPLFRGVFGGRGSPLSNAAVTVRAAPLTTEAIEAQFQVSRPLAAALQRKGGGHPGLTTRLLKRTTSDVRRIGEAAREMAAEERGYLLDLIDDHGHAGRGVVHDLLQAGGDVASTTVLRQRFGQDRAAGLECLADLIGSGLVQNRQERCVGICAELIQAGPVRRSLALPTALDLTNAPGAHPAAAATLYRLENSLRALIATELSVVDPAWWPARIPSEEAVASAEARKETEAASRLPPPQELHPLAYTDLGDLEDIILQTRNWMQVFSLTLGAVDARLDREAVRAFFADVTLVRRKIAHNRPLTENDLALLNNAARRLGVDH
jgi:energy-coupling factor transporter ATP-binding protein EcfA2